MERYTFNLCYKLGALVRRLSEVRGATLLALCGFLPFGGTLGASAADARLTTLGDLRGSLKYDDRVTRDFLDLAHAELGFLRRSGDTSFTLDGRVYRISPDAIESSLGPRRVAETDQPLYAGEEGRVQAMNWPGRLIVLNPDWDGLHWESSGTGVDFVRGPDSRLYRQMFWHEILRWAGIADDYALRFELSRLVASVTAREEEREARALQHQWRVVRIARRLARILKPFGLVDRWVHPGVYQHPRSDAGCAADLQVQDVSWGGPLRVDLKSANTAFERRAREILDRYCGDFHNPEGCEDGNVRFATLYLENDPEAPRTSSCWGIATIRFFDHCVPTPQDRIPPIPPSFPDGLDLSTVRPILRFLIDSAGRADSYCLDPGAGQRGSQI